ncbi:Sec-independent protein translocase subunit TatA [Actinomadura gamaensis]|uniref:Sec-independent protein translocase protein TatA n=1 Tax=Actinomadura gamaensis TaxID=1763541 RepID=A0ABV9U3J3_9ACTN
MGELSPSHWLIVIIVALLLFGSAKLPKMARSLGQSARILKAEMNGLHDKDEAEDAPPAAAPQVAAPQPVTPQPVASQPVATQPAPQAAAAEAPRLVSQDGQAVDRRH